MPLVPSMTEMRQSETYKNLPRGRRYNGLLKSELNIFQLFRLLSAKGFISNHQRNATRIQRRGLSEIGRRMMRESRRDSEVEQLRRELNDVRGRIVREEGKIVVLDTDPEDSGSDYSPVLVGNAHYNDLRRDRSWRTMIHKEAEMKRECRNLESSIMLTDFDSDDLKTGIVSIKLPGSQKGECYNVDTLKKYWVSYMDDKRHMVFQWRSKREGSIDETKPVFKLPISGVWIDLQAADAIRTSKIIKLKVLGKKFIGSKIHWVGGVYGHDHIIYTIIN